MKHPVPLQDPAGVWRRLLGYALPHWCMFLIGALGMVLFAATDSGMAWLVREFLDGAFVECDPRVLWFVPTAIIVLFLLRGIGDYVSNHFPGWVGRQVIKSLRAQRINRLFRPYSTRIRNSMGDVTRVTKEALMSSPPCSRTSPPVRAYSPCSMRPRSPKAARAPSAARGGLYAQLHRMQFRD